MIVFLTLAGLLSSLALFCILPSLLGYAKSKSVSVSQGSVNLLVLRDQRQELDRDLVNGVIDAGAYQIARNELTLRTAENLHNEDLSFSARKSSVIQGVVIGALFIATAGMLYTLLGTPSGIRPVFADVSGEASDQLTIQQAGAMVEQLAQQMASQPDNAKGWLLLARSYTAMARYADASKAYAHLLSQFSNDAQLLNAQFFTDYADVLAMQQGKSLYGEPEMLLKRALVIDPRNLNALVLLGSANFERGDYQEAITIWKKVLNQVPADSDIVQIVLSNLETAQARLAEKSTLAGESTNELSSSANDSPNLQKSVPGAQLSGVVELDPSLRSQVADSDTVYIFARAVNGPRFPLVVLRKQVKDLPFSFVLDDSMRMTPNVSLSKYPALIVGARISKSGSAMPEKGDLEGVTSTISPDASNLRIRISSRRD